MRFYDLHVHSAFSSGQSSLEQIARAAKDMGYAGFCFSAYYKGEDQVKQIQAEIEKVRQKVKIEIYLGFEARDAKDLEKLRNIRRRFDILLVHGGDLKMNRLAVETPEVDILTHPELNRNDSGMNDVLMRLAAKNNVAIEINFNEVASSSRGTRAKIMRNIAANVRLAKRCRAPVAVCSGALSHWEIKDPQTLVSFAHVLGMEMGDAKDSLSKIPEAGLKESKERKGLRWVMPGVKVVG